ncbi:MAG: hypothetical protein ACE5HK_03090 [Candidatus Methylomirabilales bacterium]
MHRRGIQICKARIGLQSNNKALITKSEYFADRVQQSLLTDYHRIDEIPWSADLDAQVVVADLPEVAGSITRMAGQVLAVGDFTAFEQQVLDRRFTLFGNLGLLYRYVVHVLEAVHGIHTFHASAMVDEDRGEFWLIPGPAGAGKTVFLLSGISRGWTIFSTEMTHLRVTAEGYEFYKGSLFDNIRVGNLLHGFPHVPQKLGIVLPEVQDVWGTKIAIDFAAVQTTEDVAKSPPVRIIHPKVEQGRDRPRVTRLHPNERLVKLLFDNATEKHGQTVLLYERIPLPPLDTPTLMWQRLRAIQAFVASAEIRSAQATVCSPHNCMEGIG